MAGAAVDHVPPRDCPASALLGLDPPFSAVRQGGWGYMGGTMTFHFRCWFVQDLVFALSPAAARPMSAGCCVARVWFALRLSALYNEAFGRVVWTVERVAYVPSGSARCVSRSMAKRSSRRLGVRPTPAATPGSLIVRAKYRSFDPDTGTYVTYSGGSGALQVGEENIRFDRTRGTMAKCWGRTIID